MFNNTANESSFFFFKGGGVEVRVLSSGVMQCSVFFSSVLVVSNFFLRVRFFIYLHLTIAYSGETCSPQVDSDISGNNRNEDFIRNLTCKIRNPRQAMTLFVPLYILLAPLHYMSNASSQYQFNASGPTSFAHRNIGTNSASAWILMIVGDLYTLFVIFLISYSTFNEGITKLKQSSYI